MSDGLISFANRDLLISSEQRHDGAVGVETEVSVISD